MYKKIKILQIKKINYSDNIIILYLIFFGESRLTFFYFNFNNFIELYINK